MANLAPFLKSRTVEAIDDARAAAQQPRHSRRIGGSVIGDECARRIWYAFRWAHPPERHEGRMLRLFETGHAYEDRLLADLARAGVHVFNQQGAVSFCAGHGVAKIDAMASGVPEAPKTWHIVECKTCNDKSFKALKRDGVLVSKPTHYAQMQIYMMAFAQSRALYLAVNKNDDELYAERIEYDASYALGLAARAERIIRSDRPPAKLHDDPSSKSAWVCNYCPARGLCHEQSWAERNCRTCLHATAEMDGNDGRWSCQKWRKDLTPEEQIAGCDGHRYIPDLVPGELQDADDDGEVVFYVLPDGAAFEDRGGAS